MKVSKEMVGEKPRTKTVSVASTSARSGKAGGKKKVQSVTNAASRGLSYVVNRVRAYSKEFSYGKRKHELYECCRQSDCAEKCPKSDVNKTRATSLTEMFTGVVRVWRGLDRHFQNKLMQPASKKRKTDGDSGNWKEDDLITMAMWQEVAEVEAALVIANRHSKLVQTEKGHTKAYGKYDERRLISSLQGGAAIQVNAIQGGIGQYY
jgi:hypothetical protein